jgi:hypothetical protein
MLSSTFVVKSFEIFAITIQFPIVILYGNTNIFQIDRNLVLHAKMKHIEIHHHFIRELISLQRKFQRDRFVSLQKQALGTIKH